MPADVDSRQAPANVPPPLAPSAYRPCDDGIVVPVPTRQVEPTYTDAARQARKKGIVLLDAVVLADGTVGEVRVVRSLDSTTGLDEASVRALRAWRFKPGTLAGQPVPVVVGVQLTFTP
jgi:protein TonB